MKMLNNKGFTLLELLAVLVILAALATIAIPIFTNRGEDARLVALRDNAREISSAIQRYEFENGQPAATATTYYGQLNASNDLVTKGYLSAAPISPVTTTNSMRTTTDGITAGIASTATTLPATPVYMIGLDGSTPPKTIVKLVCVGNGSAITATVPLDASYKFVEHGALATQMQEVLPTTLDGVTYASIWKS